MKLKTHRTRTDNLETDEGYELELCHEPYSEDDIHVQVVGEKIVVAYLVHDDDCPDIDDMLGDGMGRMCSFHRHASKDEHRDGLEALGRNADAVLLDVYDHSGQWWSVSGGGVRCQWDTASGAGVWLPDDVLTQQLNDDEAKGLDRRSKAVEYAEQFLSQFNAINTGDVYGCATEVFQRTGPEDDDWESYAEDSCWGFVGHDYAKETLKVEYFDSAVERLRKAGK